MKSEPLVLCLTNTVAANFTANVLLAIGAKPAMVEAPAEASELAKVADAVLINFGTVHPRQAEAMFAAVESANAAQVPWVLDPVACHQLTYRWELCKRLILKKPALIRGNHAEIDFIKRGLSPNSLGSVPSFLGSVPMLATDEVDEITVGGETEKVVGGVARLQTVTATGCAQGAICAAYLGWGQSPREAALSAAKLMKKAGEVAFSRAKAPGTFKVALVDALWELTHD